MVMTANTSLNLAIPRLVRDTGASSSQLQWIVDTYALVFAGFVLTAGAIGDRFGRKGALPAGLGAALIMPGTLSILAAVFPTTSPRVICVFWVCVEGDVMADDPAMTGDPALTTGEAARLLGTSRQHVVDLCARGSLPFHSVGRHRRVRRSDVLAFQQHPDTGGLTRDQVRSLWLHRAVAGKLLAKPERTLTIARRNLRKLQQIHPPGQAARVLAEWEQLLSAPVNLEAVAETLTSKSQRARELRQSSPFAGVLTDRERAAVLGSFRRKLIFG